MKNRKILSLLLALVLAFSAAGTAFAATSDSGSWKTYYGTMNGTSTYTASTRSVKVTTSFEKSLSTYTISLQEGIEWYIAETGEYDGLEVSDIFNLSSIFDTFRLANGSALGWTPTGARGVHTCFYKNSEGRNVEITTKYTYVTF